MKKKTLTVAIALVLVVALAVGATYAYLTAKTEAVTNKAMSLLTAPSMLKSLAMSTMKSHRA